MAPSNPPHKWHVMKRYSFIAHKDTWQVVWDVPDSTSLVLVADTGTDLYMGERDARFIAAARAAQWGGHATTTEAQKASTRSARRGKGFMGWTQIICPLSLT